jgi:hypothetical protein
MVVGERGAVLGPVAADSEEDPSMRVYFSRWRVDRSRAALASSTAGTTLSAPSSKTRARPSPPIPVQVGQRDAFREQFFSLFFEYTSASPQNAGSPAIGSNWLLDVLRLPTLSPALENATLAVCTARLGKRDDRSVLVQQSLRLYTQGLRAFAREVGDVSRQKNEQTLAASMVMMMYEVSECPGGSPDGYQAHYDGTMKLLELRGPEAHQSGLAHSVLQSFRVHNVK